MTTLNGESVYIHGWCARVLGMCVCGFEVNLSRYPAAIDLLSLRFVWCMEVKTSRQEGNTCLNELYTVHTVSVLQL